MDWQHIISFTTIVFSFLFVDIFDTVGTLIGVASKGDLLDENGKLPNAKGALLADGCWYSCRCMPGYINSYKLC